MTTKQQRQQAVFLLTQAIEHMTREPVETASLIHARLALGDAARPRTTSVQPTIDAMNEIMIDHILPALSEAAGHTVIDDPSPFMFKMGGDTIGDLERGV
jgi:hypothetical protein|tara:strand:- start:7 stop:306 length:300 start_codon:yes stop_codon:yes gene_type:complete